MRTFVSCSEDKIGWEQRLSEDIDTASPLWRDLTLFPKFKDTELLSFVFIGAMSFSGLVALWLTHCIDTVTLFKNIQLTCPPNRDLRHDYGDIFT